MAEDEVMGDACGSNELLLGEDTVTGLEEDELYCVAS